MYLDNENPNSNTSMHKLDKFMKTKISGQNQAEWSILLGLRNKIFLYFNTHRFSNC